MVVLRAGVDDGSEEPRDACSQRSSYIGPILADDVALGTTPTIDGWERFERIWLLASRQRQEQNDEYVWFEPYIRVDDDRTNRTDKDTRPLPSAWLDDSREPFRQIQDVLFGGNEDDLRKAMVAVDRSMAANIERSETRDLMSRGGSGWMPSGVRRATFKADEQRDPWPPVGSSAGN